MTRVLLHPHQRRLPLESLPKQAWIDPLSDLVEDVSGREPWPPPDAQFAPPCSCPKPIADVADEDGCRRCVKCARTVAP